MEADKLSEEIINALASPFADVLDGVGVTKEFLAERLKKEINAKETKTVKMKGAVSQDNLPQTPKGNVKRGYRIVTTSGLLSYQKTEDGPEEVFGDGDTVLEIDYINWPISQKARMDAHKLRGDYPAAKHEVTGPGGGPIITNPDLSEDERLVLKALCEERKKQIVADSLKSD